MNSNHLLALLVKRAALQIEPDLPAAEAVTDRGPSTAQTLAGNYRKGKCRVRRWIVSIENPKGSVRWGDDWEQRMRNTYGYILGTTAVDGDAVDVFLSSDPEKGSIFIVDQYKKDGVTYDESKVMIGFDSASEARAAYRNNYTPGWKGFAAITEVTEDELDAWMKGRNGKQTKPGDPSAFTKAAGYGVDLEGNVIRSFREWCETTARQRKERRLLKAALAPAGCAKFRRPENYDECDSHSVKGGEIRFFKGQNDWEEDTTWVWAEGDRYGEPQRIWVELRYTKDNHPGGDFWHRVPEDEKLRLSERNEKFVGRWIRAAEKQLKTKDITRSPEKYLDALKAVLTSDEELARCVETSGTECRKWQPYG